MPLARISSSRLRRPRRRPAQGRTGRCFSWLDLGNKYPSSPEGAPAWLTCGRMQSGSILNAGRPTTAAQRRDGLSQKYGSAPRGWLLQSRKNNYFTRLPHRCSRGHQHRASEPAGTNGNSLPWRRLSARSARCMPSACISALHRRRPRPPRVEQRSQRNMFASVRPM